METCAPDLPTAAIAPVVLHALQASFERSVMTSHGSRMGDSG